jgi:hypothetical protein
MARLPASVLQYIAGDVSWRRYGDDENVPEKVRRNLRRRFRLSLSQERANRLVENYRRMYDQAAALLPRYVTPPPPGHYVDWSQVRIPEFLGALHRKHPREPRAAIKAVGWYVIHYEYLR